MLSKNRRKMGISLLLLAAAAMLLGFAYANVMHSISLWLMGAAVLLVIAALTVFALYFKE